MDITRNAAECALCGDVVESKHRLDFRTCECGEISVDGGLFYLKRVGEPQNFIERSEFSTSPEKADTESLE